jgi:hypothetical protein
VTNDTWPNNTLIKRPVREECLNKSHNVKFSVCLSQASEVLLNNVTHVSRIVTHFRKSAMCMRQNKIKVFGPSSTENNTDMYFWNFKLNMADLMYVYNIF